MDAKEFTKKAKSDEIFLRKVAKAYLEIGHFAGVEHRLEIDKGAIQSAIDDDVDLENSLDDTIIEEANKHFNREGIFRLRQVLTKLYNIATSIEEEDGKAISQAANILTRWYGPIVMEKLKPGKTAEETEIDKLTRELENDR